MFLLSLFTCTNSVNNSFNFIQLFFSNSYKMFGYREALKTYKKVMTTHTDNKEEHCNTKP